MKPGHLRVHEVARRSMALLVTLGLAVALTSLVVWPANASADEDVQEGVEATGESTFENGDPVAAEGETSADGSDEATSDEELSSQSDDELTTMATMIQTGDTTATKPTQKQITARLLAITPYSTTRYASTPSLASPFSAGSLPDATLNNGKGWLNYMRYVAGLPDVTLDATLNQDAQTGALVQAANNTGLNHEPDQPSGMEDALFNRGYYAARTGNLSAGGTSSGTGIKTMALSSLREAVQGQMDDSSSSTNLKLVGHRRWLLNPGLTSTGMGSVTATSTDSDGYYWYYSCIRVFNYTSDSHYSSSTCGTVGLSGDVSYDAVAWPTSGEMPNNVFYPGTPWSITLNPDEYKTSSTDLGSASVTVTRQSDSDSKSWTLNKNNSASSTTTEGFKVDTGGYGVDNAIIFSIGTDNLGTSALTGKYTVTLDGIYKKGSTTATSVTYGVTFFDPTVALSDCTITLDKTSYDYTGSQIQPTVTVKYGEDTPLTKDYHYTVSYGTNKAAGTDKGTVTITGTSANGLTGKVTKTFTINPVAISGATVSSIANQTYTGSEIKPTPTVTYGGKTLAVGTDYSLSYADNTKAGTATVTVTGKGNYSGTTSKTFTIDPKALSSATVSTIANQTYTGSGIEPEPSVKDGSTVLVKGTDYTLGYSSNTNVGTATVTITGAGNYTGTKSATFKIVAQAISSAAVAAIPDQTYTGGALTPALTVTYGGKTLSAGTDYTVEYAKNTNAGTATVTITGKGNFTGTKTATFTIDPKAINTCTVIGMADQAYTGSAITPTPKVISGSTVLAAGTDYTYEYKDNTNVGQATITFTGTGNYTGTTSGVFVIKAVAIKAATVAPIPDQSWTGSALTPTPTLTYNGKTLVKGTDYTLEYGINTSIGEGTITISGIGNFSGTTIATFKIVAQAISSAAVAAIPDQTYTGGALTPALTVTYGGKTLSAGTDYTVEYANNINVGTATVTITGRGNFTGTTIRYFPVVAKDISTCTVGSVADQTYTGSAIKPEPSVTLDGTKLTFGADFTYVYGDNTNAGTDAGSVTISGTGNYAGTKKVSFNIDPATITSAMVASIPTQAWTGQEVRPSVKVVFKGRTLTQGTDYTLTYANNTNAGTATATITGTGNFTGSVNTTFTITKRSLASATISSIPSQTYTGSAIKPAVSVSYGGRTLTNGVDYKVSYANNVVRGTATVTVTGTGLYSGSKTATFKITPAVRRLAGNTALDTMTSVTGAGWAAGSCKTVIVATMDGYWDALSATALAGLDANSCPVLMTSGTSLSSQTASEIRRLGATKVYIAGGTAAVSTKVENSIKALGCSTERLAGANAVGTSVRVYEEGKGNWGTTAIVATNDGYWDALAASPYAYAKHAPIFLYNAGTKRLDSSVVSAISAGGFKRVLVCGGTGAVSDAAVQQLKAVGVTVTRLGGATAVETSARIAQQCLDDGMSANGVGVATVDGYWDALTGAALCGRNGAPLVLASDSNRTAITGFVASNRSQVSRAYVFGGQAAVSNGTLDALVSALG